MSHASQVLQVPVHELLVVDGGNETELVEVARQGPPGPPGQAGMAGQAGQAGPSGTGGDLSYRHIQAVPAQQWDVIHGLAKYPSVSVTDSAGGQVEGDLQYTGPNTLILRFSAAFSGTAYLN